MDFVTAFTRLIDPKHEGGYANNPADPGGETYKGVARNRHPDWLGWEMLDAHKVEADFPTCLDRDADLLRAIRIFYQVKFWGPAGCEAAPGVLKYDLFDMAVNQGVGAAVKALQHAAGVEEDGSLGPKTLRAVAASHPVRLLMRFDAARLVHYAECSDTLLDDFGRGWLHRLGANMTAA